MYDVIVVGARCAGASTALLLAQAGHRVLLLDRAYFPSDTMSTHYVHQPAIARLKRWGLLDSLHATGCPPLEIARWNLEGVSLTGCCPPVDGVRAAYGPRRYVLDALLVEAAAEAGAEVREGCHVSELSLHDGRVTGVVCRSDQVGDCVERGRVIVGADGIGSAVARLVDAPMYDEAPSQSCLFYTYWSGLPADYEVYVANRTAIGVVPTHDQLVMVGIQWPRSEFARIRSNVEEAYLSAIAATAPELAERMKSAERTARFVGTGRLPNYFRQAAGQGWALVGDAGYHKDPVGAYGISDAFTHAELLAGAIDRGLRAEVPMADALNAYAAERDREASARYHFNLEAAQFAPLPEMVAILRSISGDQQQVDRFFGLIAGALTPQEFFTDELIAGVHIAA